MPGPRPGRASRPARRLGGVLRRRSQDRRRFVVQSIEGGGWGGRPTEDGESGIGLGLPGRRAQRLDRGDRAEMPGAGRGPRAAHAIPAAPGKYPRRARHRPAGREFRRRPLELRAHASATTARPGASGAASRPTTADYLLRLPRENDFRSVGGAHRPVPADSRGDRAHRRRRRLGRSARARSRARARRRARGIRVARRGARGITASC